MLNPRYISFFFSKYCIKQSCRLCSDMFLSLILTKAVCLSSKFHPAVVIYFMSALNDFTLCTIRDLTEEFVNNILLFSLLEMEKYVLFLHPRTINYNLLYLLFTWWPSFNTLVYIIQNVPNVLIHCSIYANN